jgi:hypothetical protein
MAFLPEDDNNVTYGTVQFNVGKGVFLSGAGLMNRRMDNNPLYINRLITKSEPIVRLVMAVTI